MSEPEGTLPVMDRPLCKCHGEPMRKSGTQSNGSPKFQCAVKGRERQRRYSQSEKWRETKRRSNAMRLRFGDTYLGTADTPEQAAAINAHLRERLAEFKAQQSTNHEKES